MSRAKKAKPDRDVDADAADAANTTVIAATANHAVMT